MHISIAFKLNLSQNICSKDYLLWSQTQKKHRVVFFFTKITDLYVTDTSEYHTVMIVRADRTTLMYSNDETLIQFICALATKDEINQWVMSDEVSSTHVNKRIQISITVPVPKSLWNVIAG